MKASVTLAGRLLSALRQEGDVGERGALAHAAEGLEGTLELMRHMAPSGEHVALLSFLEHLVPKIETLAVHKVLTIPLAWSAHARALLLVLHRTSEALFSVTVCNCGDGADRHPSRLDGASGGVERATSLPLLDVRMEQVTDSGFWFLVFRGLFVASAKNAGPATFYDQLLPALTARPVLAQVGPDNPYVRWRTPPLSSDASHAHLVVEAFEASLCASGLLPAHAAYAAVLWKWTALQLALSQLSDATHGVASDAVLLSASDAVLLRLACQHTAHAAARLADGPLPLSAHHAALLQGTVARLEEAVATARRGVASAAPPPLELGAQERIPSAARFPLFGRLVQDNGVEHLAGENAVPPVVLPVELSLVPDHVRTFNEVCNALRHTAQLCEILANQMRDMTNTYLVRVSLIQHLVTQVIPLPMPCTHPERGLRCFWATQEMRYETQADLLRLLNMVCRHFAACCFSIRVTRSFDAVRLVTVACLATIADAVMRIRTCDVPSLLCLSYSGTNDGPPESRLPFGFEVGSFAVESEDLQLASPELHAARMQVQRLDARRRMPPCTAHPW